LLSYNVDRRREIVRDIEIERESEREMRKKRSRKMNLSLLRSAVALDCT
jgi:hypothetical protein